MPAFRTTRRDKQLGRTLRPVTKLDSMVRRLTVESRRRAFGMFKDNPTLNLKGREVTVRSWNVRQASGRGFRDSLRS